MAQKAPLCAGWFEICAQPLGAHCERTHQPLTRCISTTFISTCQRHFLHNVPSSTAQHPTPHCGLCAQEAAAVVTDAREHCMALARLASTLGAPIDVMLGGWVVGGERAAVLPCRGVVGGACRVGGVRPAVLPYGRAAVVRASASSSVCFSWRGWAITSASITRPTAPHRRCTQGSSASDL